MLRKDYIQRQFEEFGKVLASLLSFKRNRDWDNFQKEIAETSKKFTSMELRYAEEIEPEAFDKEVLNGLQPDQQKMLADLLFEKLDYYLEVDDLERYADLKERCLLLYRSYVANQTHNEFDLGVHYRIELLEKSTGD